MPPSALVTSRIAVVRLRPKSIQRRHPQLVSSVDSLGLGNSETCDCVLELERYQLVRVLSQCATR